MATRDHLNEITALRRQGVSDQRIAHLLKCTPRNLRRVAGTREAFDAAEAGGAAPTPTPPKPARTRTPRGEDARPERGEHGRGRGVRTMDGRFRGGKPRGRMLKPFTIDAATFSVDAADEVQGIYRIPGGGECAEDDEGAVLVQKLGSAEVDLAQGGLDDRAPARAEAEYTCPECGRPFIFPQSLDLHRRRLHPVRPS